MNMLKILEAQRMKILAGLSVISAGIAVILFIRHVWLCYPTSDKRRYARVFNH